MFPSKLLLCRSRDTFFIAKPFFEKCSIENSNNGKFYNRAFFITPEGEEYYYDKRHLFRMAEEDKHFSAGDKRLIVPYKGWNICLQVCYDLRFPVWSRNVNNEYDLLIYVANWPEARKKAWKALLHADRKSVV